MFFLLPLERARLYFRAARGCPHDSLPNISSSIILNEAREKGILSPNLKMRNLRLREIKGFSQGHTTGR